MGKNKPRYSAAKDHSMEQVFDFARGYYALSQVLIDALPKRLEDVRSPGANMGAIVASATNRVLALELYLKALLIGWQLPVLWDHDLVKLYGCIAKDKQELLSSEYAERIKLNREPGVSWSLRLEFQLDFDSGGKGLLERQPPVDESLESLLERNKDGFVVSRYLFQQGKFDKPTHFEYEYHRLGVICVLIHDWIAEVLPKQEAVAPGVAG